MADNCKPALAQRLISKACRHYPFLSGAGRIANSPAFKSLETGSGGPFWAEVEGGLVLADLEDFVGRAAYYFGDLDPKLSAIAKRLVKPGDIALDIGANIGIVTLLLGKLVGDFGTVLAFEPNGHIFQSLNDAIQRAGMRQVKALNCALGDARTTLRLTVPRDNKGAGSLTRHGQASDSDEYDVPVNTLDDIADEYRLPRIDFIKLDVEGFEINVLRGARKVFSTLRPTTIVFENNAPRNSQEYEEPMRFFRENGYDILEIPRTLVKLRATPLPPLAKSSAHDFIAVLKGSASLEARRILN